MRAELHVSAFVLPRGNRRIHQRDHLSLRHLQVHAVQTTRQQMGLACCLNMAPCDMRTPSCGQALFCRLRLQVKSLDDCSHAFSFWEGVPTTAKHAFGRLFAATPSLQVRRGAQSHAARQHKQHLCCMTCLHQAPQCCALHTRVPQPSCRGSQLLPILKAVLCFASLTSLSPSTPST